MLCIFHCKSTTSEESWAELEDLAFDTRCKVEAMKMVARWLIGLKDDTISAGKTFRMLNAHLVSKGDLHESRKLRLVFLTLPVCLPLVSLFKFA